MARSAAGTRTQVHPHHPRLLFGALVGVTSYTLLQSMTVPALPRIQADLATSQAAASWILTAFLIAASVATPIVGRLGDTYGKSRMFVASLGLLALGSLGAAFATDIRALVAARVVQGLAGGLLPLAFGILRDELPAARVPSGVALLSSLMSVGFGAGIVISGPLVELVGYRPLFLLPMLTAAVAALGALRLVPDPPDRSGRPVRLLPAVLLAGWLVCGLLAVSQAPEDGWTSVRTVALLTAAVLLGGAWVVVESVLDAPLIDLALVCERRLAGANAVALLIGVSMYGSFGFLPQLVQTPATSGYGLGASVAESGYLMLPTAVLSFAAGLLSPRLAGRWGERWVLVAGCWLSATGLVGAALLHRHAAEILVANCLTGLGSGVAFAVLANVVVSAAPAGRVGVATGLNANLRTIGGAIGSAVLASILAQHLLSAGYPEESGYTLGFLVLAGASGLAGAAALTLPRTARRPLLVRDGERVAPGGPAGLVRSPAGVPAPIPARSAAPPS